MTDSPLPPDDQAGAEADALARLRARAAEERRLAEQGSSAPDPEAAAAPEPAAVAPEPEPAAVAPEPEPAAVAPEPEPAAVAPEPEAVPAPEPVATVPPVPADPEPAVAPAPAPSRAPRHGPFVLASAVAAALVLALTAVAAVALAGVVTDRVSTRNAGENARDAVVAATAGGLKRVLSYDYRHLDSDFSAAEALLTPKFRKKYVDTATKGVRPLALRYKTVTTADVSAAGVIDISGDRALVLAFVNQASTNTQLSAPRLDRSRIKVTLVRSGGRWLIDNLQPI